MPSMVVACHRLEVARCPSGVEARSRPAGCIPCITISLRPKSQRQRPNFALSLTGSRPMRSSRTCPHALGNRIEFDLLTNELSKLLGGLRGL